MPNPIPTYLLSKQKEPEFEEERRKKHSAPIARVPESFMPKAVILAATPAIRLHANYSLFRTKLGPPTSTPLASQLQRPGFPAALPTPTRLKARPATKHMLLVSGPDRGR